MMSHYAGTSLRMGTMSCAMSLRSRHQCAPFPILPTHTLNRPHTKPAGVSGLLARPERSVTMPKAESKCNTLQSLVCARAAWQRQPMMRIFLLALPTRCNRMLSDSASLAVYASPCCFPALLPTCPTTLIWRKDDHFLRIPLHELE